MQFWAVISNEKLNATGKHCTLNLSEKMNTIHNSNKNDTRNRFDRYYFLKRCAKNKIANRTCSGVQMANEKASKNVSVGNVAHQTQTAVSDATRHVPS